MGRVELLLLSLEEREIDAITRVIICVSLRLVVVGGACRVADWGRRVMGRLAQP